MIKIGEIQELFHRRLKHNIQTIEASRKLMLGYQFIHILGYFMVLAVILAGKSLVEFDPVAFVGAFAGSIGVICVFALAHLVEKRKYLRKYKTYIVKPLVEFIDPTWKYISNKGVDQDEVAQSRLFLQHFDLYQSDDLVSGEVGQTDFRCADVHLQKLSTLNGPQSIFQGLFFHADFHKHFRGRVFVTPDFTKGKWGNAGTFIQKHLVVGQGELVKMENQEFERLYMVYATNPIEARYILTPAIMEAMVKIRKLYDSPVSFSFINTRMYCAVNFDEELFEPGIYRSAVKYRDIQFMYALLKLNKLIIEQMHLNTRVWTKA